MNRKSRVRFDSPYDTLPSAGIRFLMELTAWVAMPWWAWEASGPVSGIPTLVMLVAIPAVFSTTGDKRKVIVPTPGSIRVGIEVALFAGAVLGAWMAWSPYSGVGVAVVAMIGLVAGRRRIAWLLRGAPLENV